MVEVRWNPTLWKLQPELVRLREFIRTDVRGGENRGQSAGEYGNLLCTAQEFLVYPWSQDRRLALRYIGSKDADSVENWITDEAMLSDEIKTVKHDTFFSRCQSSVTLFTVNDLGFGASTTTTISGEVCALPVSDTYERAGAVWHNKDTWGYDDIINNFGLELKMPQRASDPLCACFMGFEQLAIGHHGGVHCWDLSSNRAWPLFSLRKNVTAVEKVSDHMFVLAGYDAPNWLFFYDARNPTKQVASLPLPISLEEGDIRPQFHLQLHTSSVTTIVACAQSGVCVLPTKLEGDILDIYSMHIEDTRVYCRIQDKGILGRTRFFGAAWQTSTDTLWWSSDGDYLFRSQIELHTAQQKYPLGLATPIPEDRSKSVCSTSKYSEGRGITFLTDKKPKTTSREFTYLKGLNREFTSELQQMDLIKNDVVQAANILGLLRNRPSLAKDLEYDPRVEDILRNLGAWPLPGNFYPVAALPIRRLIRRNELPTVSIMEHLDPVDADSFVLRDIPETSVPVGGVLAGPQALKLQSAVGGEFWRKQALAICDDNVQGGSSLVAYTANSFLDDLPENPKCSSDSSSLLSSDGIGSDHSCRKTYRRARRSQRTRLSAFSSAEPSSPHIALSTAFPLVSKEATSSNSVPSAIDKSTRRGRKKRKR